MATDMNAGDNNQDQLSQKGTEPQASKMTDAEKEKKARDFFRKNP